MPTTSRADAAYAAAVAQVRRRADEYASARFAAGQHRDADVRNFLAAVVPVVLAGRRQVAALTDAHLSKKVAAFTGRKAPARGRVDTDNLRGVAAVELYRRPFETVWWKLSLQMPYDAAVSVGAARLSTLVTTDMQLAKTTTAQRVLDVPGVNGTRRVLSAGACPLCIEAADQVYATGGLMPVHNGCTCGEEPTDEAPTTIPPDTVEEHDELGPTLTN
jgi:hypothetical protein